MNWHSDDNDFTLPSRAASSHHSDEISDSGDNNAESVVSDRLDIGSDHFSDVSEEYFSDIRDLDLDSDSDEGATNSDKAETESMNVEDNACSDSPPGQSTPALDHLKAELVLLGGYKCPAQAPTECFIIPPLDSAEKLSLLHYIAWQTSGGMVKAYKLHSKVLEDATGITIFSLFRVQSLAKQLTRLTPRKVNMCLNSCIAYTGEYAGLDACPYIHTSATIACGAALL